MRPYSSRRKSSQKVSFKARHLTSYTQVVKFLLEKYAADEIITQTDSTITRFVQLAGMNPLLYAEEIVP